MGRITAVTPPLAIPGARIALAGGPFDLAAGMPQVRVGGAPAIVSAARGTRLEVVVPAGLPGGATEITVEGSDARGGVEIGRLVADGLHQVDSPVFDAEGRIYLTYSGGRGQQVPVSLFRVGPDGARESLVTGLMNPTSMAVGPDGLLYVSSRFEGVVYKVDDGGLYETVVSEVGVPTGLAFTRDGTLLVGDRSGTIFRVRSTSEAVMLASLPPSVAAFHLAMGPDDHLYVSAPTLTTRDAIYRVSLDGQVDVAWEGFGRPQGLAFDPTGALLVVEALAGASGVYRLRPGSGEPPELILAGPGLVGVAVNPAGGLAVVTGEAAWMFDASPQSG